MPSHSKLPLNHTDDAILYQIMKPPVSVSSGILNVHASLLPKWRGACPIIHSILNGDAVTGVSIMQLRAKKMDVGDILSQRQATIPDNVLMPELHEALAKDGAELLLECFEDLPASVRNARPQNGDATYGNYRRCLLVIFTAVHCH